MRTNLLDGRFPNFLFWGGSKYSALSLGGENMVGLMILLCSGSSVTK